MESKNDHNGGNPNSFRLVMLGEQAVGKSSITHRLVREQFNESSAPTIGAAYLNKSIKVGERTVKLDLWDTAGQERFAPLAPMYYRTAQSAVVAYDICRKESLDRAMEWVKELRNQVPTSIVIVLCGNKVDKEQDRKVTLKEGRDMALDNCLMFYEVSAKTGQGVKDMFYTIAETLIANRSRDGVDGSNKEERNIRLLRNASEDKNKCSC